MDEREVEAKDSAGNTSTKTFKITVQRDTDKDGIPDVTDLDDDELMNDAQSLVRNSIEKASKSEGANIEAMRKSVRNALSNFLWSNISAIPAQTPKFPSIWKGACES